MKLTVNKVDALKRKLQFEIPQERVSRKMNEVFGEISKVAKVKGFRPGKAPRHVIEAEHGPLAREETLKKLIPEVYEEGLRQENISPLEMPDIQDVEFKDGKIKFTAEVTIKPDVKISEYKGIKVQRKSPEVTEEDINKTLDYFKTGQGKDAETKIDDEFARGLGYPSLDAFKKSLKTQMEIDKDRQNRADVENQIVEALLKNSKLTVPQSLVKKQLDRRVHEAIGRMKQQGLPEEEINKKVKELEKELKEPVEKDIKVYLILDKIAELENVQAGEGGSLPAKVMEFLMKKAEWKDAQEAATSK